MNICIRCGYDLQRLPIEGACPECGTPIAESLHGPWLAKADPHWLSRIAIGQSILAWCLFLAAAGTVVLFIWVPFAFIAAPTGDIGRVIELIITIIMMATAIGVLVGLIGCGVGAFLLTTQEPKEREREAALSSRHLSRWGMVAAIAAVAISLAVGVLPLSAVARMATLITLYVLTTAAVTVAIVATLSFLAGLAQRIPDEKLAQRTNNSARTLRWAIPVFAAAQFLSGPAGIWPALSGSWQLVEASIACTVLIIAILLIIQIVRISNAMFDYGRALGRCRTTAHGRG